MRRYWLILVVVGVGSGCGSNLTLTVEPREAQAPQLVPSPQLSQHAYRKVLLLPPEQGVDAKDVDIVVVRDAAASYYTGKLEKALLAAGFEVISSEVVARADQGKQKLSGAERALLLGKQSKADAVLVMQSVSARGLARYFMVDEEQNSEVQTSDVVEDDGEYFDRQSERCLHRIPFYEVGFEGKLLDARSGAVLWVGSAKQSSIDVIKDNWTAEVDGDCEVIEENFSYQDYQGDETTFDNTVSTLFDRLVKPLAKAALSGPPIEEAKPAPREPMPPPPPAPAPKLAVVSSASAALRDGPAKSYKKRMTVPRKAKVEILETMGEWFKVEVQDGTVGWMHESTLIAPE